MKRLCVFYYKANQWFDKPVDWIVCKECSRDIRRKKLLVSFLPQVTTVGDHTYLTKRRKRAKNAS